MENIEHNIYLELNCMGYNGSEINEILPDFMSERKTVIGLTWEPLAEGPEWFTLIVTISAPLSVIGIGFLTELGKDLYHWSKSKLLPVFKKKNCPVGDIGFRVGNINISGLIEDDMEPLLKLFSSLPDLISKIDSNLSEGELEIEYNVEKKIWITKYQSK